MELVAINLSARRAITSDGYVFPIVNLLDEFGNEALEEEEAMAFTAGPDANGRWWTGLVSNYDSTKVTWH